LRLGTRDQQSPITNHQFSIMLHGIPVSFGVAVGRAFIIRFRGTPAFRRAVPPDQIEEEVRRVNRGARRAADEFLRHSRDARGEMGTELAAILEAHGLIASDETLLAAIAERIRDERVNAEWALASVAQEFGARLEASDSAPMRERAADVADVTREIGRQLTGGDIMISRELPRGTILVADELSPVAAARLDPRRVRGLALERGGPTSHASIIARSFGLPAVVGIAGVTQAVSPDRPILVDGERGLVDPSPSKDRIRRALLRAREERDRNRRLRAKSARPGATRDGVRVPVRANLELPEEIPVLGRSQAEGVGLFRSEFLYLKASPRLPGIEEQRAAYEQLLNELLHSVP
jgi:phosphotransferase system enzyme I (PtsI)